MLSRNYGYLRTAIIALPSKRRQTGDKDIIIF